ncbi:WcaF family extracellular polysaccharide biosynthesis acetyltransferase [Rhodomicrobium sp. Az07]|uniref:WcaF family extracellular polysaccharide biosynthesis acetyltransferase n=1 Tax=Rhodomicrobium sp. Az07 TaxID=2839034 RepID=UPI001BE6FBBA|nr:WcaF family extracellular polysaccharide biosynthesis acetyltransferase [Rhodomicrobium sp. Az07]MBT3071362.1 WcaF family extracellular polysaccharide biosynthesis acetyltransferase [Rhodomicrobium sp. Az07]
MTAAKDRFPNLADFSAPGFVRGRSRPVEALWLAVQWALISSWLPGSAHRRAVLRLFGAKIGAGVVIKPGVRVKFPWRLEIGADSWIGEDVWIDNLAPVAIGRDCCLSQGAYLCTGSHDWTSRTFDLITKGIRVEDGAWIAAKAVVAPGVVVGEGAVLGLGGVAMRDLAPWGIYRGNPAERIAERRPDTFAFPPAELRRTAEGAEFDAV